MAWTRPKDLLRYPALSGPPLFYPGVMACPPSNAGFEPQNKRLSPSSGVLRGLGCLIPKERTVEVYGQKEMVEYGRVAANTGTPHGTLHCGSKFWELRLKNPHTPDSRGIGKTGNLLAPGNIRLCRDAVSFSQVSHGRAIHSVRTRPHKHTTMPVLKWLI